MSHMTDVPPFVYRFYIAVEVDAVAHGFDLSRADAKHIVESAIDAAEGLRVLVPVESGEDTPQ